MRGIADVATGRILDIGERDFTPTAGQVLFFAPAVTAADDRGRWCREHRVNSDASVRAASAAEMADYDTWRAAATLDSEAACVFDAQKAIKALALLLLDEINILRTNPSATLPARTEAQLRTAFLNRYTAL